MYKQTFKEVIKEMCGSYPGGRSAMAGALGMTEEKFNNKLYEKNGCRSFDRFELETIEDLSGTYLLTQYFAKRRGLLLVEPIPAEEIDEPELFRLKMSADAKKGELIIHLNKSLEDGKVDQKEEGKAWNLFNETVSKATSAFMAFLNLHREKK